MKKILFAIALLPAVSFAQLKKVNLTECGTEAYALMDDFYNYELWSDDMTLCIRFFKRGSNYYYGQFNSVKGLLSKSTKYDSFGFVVLGSGTLVLNDIVTGNSTSLSFGGSSGNFYFCNDMFKLKVVKPK